MTNLDLEYVLPGVYVVLCIVGMLMMIYLTHLIRERYAEEWKNASLPDTSFPKSIKDSLRAIVFVLGRTFDDKKVSFVQNCTRFVFVVYTVILILFWINDS